MWEQFSAAAYIELHFKFRLTKLVTLKKFRVGILLPVEDYKALCVAVRKNQNSTTAPRRNGCAKQI